MTQNVVLLVVLLDDYRLPRSGGSSSGAARITEQFEDPQVTIDVLRLIRTPPPPTGDLVRLMRRTE